MYVSEIDRMNIVNEEIEISQEVFVFAIKVFSFSIMLAQKASET